MSANFHEEWDVGPAVHHQLSGTQAAQMQRRSNGHTLSAASTVAFNLAGAFNVFPSAKFVTLTLKQPKSAKELVSSRLGKEDISLDVSAI